MPQCAHMHAPRQISWLLCILCMCMNVSYCLFASGRSRRLSTFSAGMHMTNQTNARSASPAWMYVVYRYMQFWTFHLGRKTCILDDCQTGPEQSMPNNEGIYFKSMRYMNLLWLWSILTNNITNNLKCHLMGLGYL